MQHLNKEDKDYLKKVENEYFNGKSLKESIIIASRSFGSRKEREVSKLILVNLS